MLKKSQLFMTLLLPVLFIAASLHAQATQTKEEKKDPVFNIPPPGISQVEKEIVTAFLNKDVDGVLEHCIYPFTLALVGSKIIRDPATLRTLLQHEMERDYLAYFFKGKRSIQSGYVVYHMEMSDKKNKSGAKPFIQLMLVPTKLGPVKLMSLEVGD